MAEIILSNAAWFANGSGNASAVVGYESQRNRVVRYLMATPASGASSVALSFTGNWEGNGTLPEQLSFYIGTDPDSHANAGADSTKTGTLTRTSGTYNYTGSADIILLPNTTYYVWVFPATTTFGWLYWGKQSGDAIVTTSGGAISSFEIGNGTLGTSQTITVTKHNSSFTHTIKYVCGTASGTICDKASNTSITWTPPADLAKQNTVGTVVSVAVTLQTHDASGNDIGDPVTKTVTMTIPDVPSIDLGVADAMGYADTYGSYVKLLSRFSVAVVANATNGASIVSYRVEANGTVYTESEFFTDAIASLDYTTIKATVTDSRGRTASATQTVSIMDYAPPTITAMTAFRCDADGNDDENGEYVKVKFSANVTPLNDLNRTSSIVYWRVTDAVDYAGSQEVLYESQQYAIEDMEVIIGGGISIASSYDVEVVVEDNHIGKIRTAVVPTSFALMHFRADGTGMAFGKLSEQSDAIEFGLPMYDKDGALIGNGLAAYGGGGDSGIDPNTTLESLCLTSHTNAPQGLGTFYYIHTAFYNAKAETAARAQIAFPYKKTGSAYHRYYASGAWSSWARYMTADEAKSALLDEMWPVNSIYISYSHTSPAELFGGTWHRIESRFLWGAPSTSTLGATAGEQTHTLTESEMPSHTHDTFQRDPNAASYPSYQYMVDTYATGATAYGFSPSMSAATGKKRMLTGSKGGGEAHNNMPPYVNVAIWRRTA